jgi:hypothetical protein
VVCLGKKVSAFCYSCSEDNAMTIQLAPKTEELGNNINYFLDNLLRPTDLDIHCLKKEAENLIKIDAAAAYNYLGCIAVLENNKKDVISSFENAIKLAPSSSIIHLNYSVLLSLCGLHNLALKRARENFNKFHNNKDILLELFNRIIFTARFNEARKLSDKIEDKNKLQLVSHAAKIFEAANLTDDEAQYLQTLAYSVIEKNNLYHFWHEFDVVDDCVCFTIYIDKPVEEIFDINWELSGVLADNVEDMRCDVLNFTYSSIEVLRERKEYERSI